MKSIGLHFRYLLKETVHRIRHMAEVGDRLATTRKVQSSNPGEAEIFLTRSERPRSPHPFVLFPGAEAAGTCHMITLPNLALWLEKG